MRIKVDAELIKKGRAPHELFMVNLLLFHLLAAPAAIALKVGDWGFLLPLGLSLSVMAYSYVRARQTLDHGHWFVAMQWRFALARYRKLLIAYAATAAVLGLGALVAMGSKDVHMREILDTVFIRIAIMPTLIMVMVSAFLESSAIASVSNGEVPNWLAERYPTGQPIEVIE